MLDPPNSSVPPGPGALAPHGKTAGGRADLARMALGALGVVYGDIGTSPLYAMRECMTAPHGVAATTGNVLGVLSLIFWSLTFVISIKYLRFVMRADNKGEGGVLSLLALVVSPREGKGVGKGKEAGAAGQSGDKGKSVRRATTLAFLGLFGAALLYGDGMITPAISVLSAIEGLEVATTAFSPFVVPITCGILVVLFMVQRRGTGGIGAVFGPLTLCWFIAIAAVGLPHVIRNPQVLAAVNPVHALRFLAHQGFHGFLVLGSVVLCITGGEALYADMGHFGRHSIKVAWYAVVFPALLINYFGQGALLLEHPETANPFFALVPSSLLYPMVAIATVAAIVASQALISGAFSLTRQAIQLGYAPRMTIVHTSGKTEGQIYIPEVNGLLMVSCVALVLGFRESARLADAYGIAVTGTMAITSVLFYFVARERWGWSAWRAGGVVGLFLAFDLAFFAACATKIASGGWFPLVVAAVVFAVTTTWKRGRSLLGATITSQTIPIDLFITDVELSRPPRVKGTAVFLTSTPRGIPNVLLHHFKHNKVLHEQVVILSVVTDTVPEVPRADRLRFKSFGQGFWALTAHYGFMETPNVPDLLGLCVHDGLRVDSDTSYYVGRETLLITRDRNLAFWRKGLFRFLSRNARSASDFFALPPNRVVEIGTQIEL
ncbi:MAG: potassium uptake protein [Bacteroidota bacterium]